MELDLRFRVTGLSPIAVDVLDAGGGGRVDVLAAGNSPSSGTVSKVGKPLYILSVSEAEKGLLLERTDRGVVPTFRRMLPPSMLEDESWESTLPSRRYFFGSSVRGNFPLALTE